MGGTTEIISKVTTPDYGTVEITTANGRQYRTDLSSFSKVYCYPKTKDEWLKVSIDSYGLGLIWASRFEVHADQVIGLGVELNAPEMSVQA